METFEELQMLWQGQPAPAWSAESLLQDLRSHSRKHTVLYAAKAGTALLLAGPMLTLARMGTLSFAGGLLAVAGAAVMLGTELARQRAMARLSYSAPGIEFAREAIARLRRMRRPGIAQYAALLFGPVLGLNLMELHFLEAEELPLRLAVHVGFSLFALGAAAIGFWVRARRFERETRPLLERLEAFLGSPEI